MVNEASLKVGILYIEDAYGMPNGSLPPEMFDFIKIVAMGAKKYELNGWLKPDGVKTDEKSMHASIFRHVAESATLGPKARDHESNEDPLLHAMCRNGMLYTRRKRGIVNPIDEETK